MLRTIAKPVVAVLVARVALGFDRVGKARATEEEAATALVRALVELRASAAVSPALRDAVRNAAEAYIDAARARGRQWPRRARRSAVHQAGLTYRYAVQAVDAAHEATAKAEALHAAIALLIARYPELSCEVPDPPKLAAAGESSVGGGASAEPPPRAEATALPPHCVQLQAHRSESAPPCPGALATG